MTDSKEQMQSEAEVVTKGQELSEELDKCRNDLMSEDGEWSDAEHLSTIVDLTLARIRELDAEAEKFEAFIKTTDARIQEQFQEICALKAELERTRWLVQCCECGEGIGSRSLDGWMANYCPGCQAEMYLPPEVSSSE